MDVARIRFLVAPVAVFAVLGVVLYLLFQFWTSSPSIIRSDVAANIAAQYEQQQPVDDSAEAPEIISDNPVAVQTDLLQQNVFSGLVKWAAYILGLGLFLSIGWSWHAAQTERSTFGPKGQSKLMWVWLLTAIGYLVGAGAAFVVVLMPADLGRTIAATDLALAVFGTSVAGLLGYWAATALGASPVMRPSVPLSFLLAR